MTRDELIALIDEKVVVTDGGEEGYEQAANSLAAVAVAAFNYAASELGVTGFQASWAALRAYADELHITGPFVMLRGENLLYPQYDLHRELDDSIAGWQDWLVEQAQRKLAEDAEHAAVRVVAHWETIVRRGGAK